MDFPRFLCLGLGVRINASPPVYLGFQKLAAAHVEGARGREPLGRPLFPTLLSKDTRHSHLTGGLPVMSDSHSHRF